MKLRSAQFVLLVLLFSSLSLSEDSSLRLAGEFIGSGSGVLLSHQAAAGATEHARPSSTATANSTILQTLPAAQRQTLARPWTMPHPAAQAASLQATTANARA